MKGPLAERDGVVLLGAFAAAVLVAQQVVGRVTRDASFLTLFPATALPPVMMAASLVSILVAFGVSRLIAARGPRQALHALVAANAALILLEYALVSAAPGVAAALLYLQVTALGGALLSGYWSVVNESFDPWTARQVVGRLGLGASLGGIGGAALAWAAAGVMPLASMLLVMAGLNVVLLVALVRFGAAAPAAPSPRPSPRSSPLQTLRRIPFLGQLALVVGLGAMSDALLDYLLKAQAAASVGPGAGLASFFAAFSLGVNLLTLAAHTLATRPTLETLGLAGTVALRPAAVAFGSIAGIVDPRLWSAALSRGTHDVLSNSLYRSGYELFYTPLPEGEKRTTKPVVDVAYDKLGALLGGAAALAAVSLLHEPARALFAVAGGLSMLVLALTGRLQRGYVAALQESLLAGRIGLHDVEAVDSTTRLTLAETGFTRPRSETTGEAVREAGSHGDAMLRRIADLRSDEPDRVRRALRDAGPGDRTLVAHIVPLLGKNDLYSETLRALRRLAPRSTGQLLDALLDPELDPSIRQRVPRVLKASPSRRAVDGLLLGLEDASFEVRSQCGLALAEMGARNPGLAVRGEAVLAAVRSALAPGSQATAAGTDAALLDHVFVLLSLVLEREPLRMAATALRSPDHALKGTALEYLDNVLPSDVSALVLARVGAGRPGSRRRPVREVLAELSRASEASGLRPRG
jgi:hypothetical protein